MEKTQKFSFNISEKIIAVIGFYILFNFFFNAFGSQAADQSSPSNPNNTFHISGQITDITSSQPIQNARIMLLDYVSRDTLYDDIYTDINGNYDRMIDIYVTDIDDNYPILQPAEYLINNYPNPISGAAGGNLNIQYTIPKTQLETPVFEIFNILGKRLDVNSYFPAGVYFFRLMFNDNHLTGLKKIVLTSGGRLNVSLEQIVKKNSSQPLRQSKKTLISDDSVNVIFAIEKIGFVSIERVKTLFTDKNNVNDFGLVEEGQKSGTTIDSTGGTITVVNSRNDTIQLTIPRYAVWNPTLITLTALNNQLENPIEKNIFPGVSIAPGGLTLLKSATLTIDLATVTPDTNTAVLFSIKQSDFVLPISNQVISNNIIQGEINHFSEIIGGEPTGGEGSGQVDKAGDSNPSDWEGTYDAIDALLWWSEFLTRMGRGEEGQEAMDKAKEILDKAVRDFLNKPIPENPCGEYLTTLLKFTELVNLIIGGELERQLQDRVIEVVNKCNLRGEIEYNHYLDNSGVGTHYITVKGNIPFYVNTLVQPYGEINGEGTADIVVKDFGQCILSCNGILRVNYITGELKPDQLGIWWLEMKLNETWYESTNCFLKCPDPADDQSWSVDPYTLNSVAGFLVQDGWSYVMPFAMGGGQYEYILHIIHQP